MSDMHDITDTLQGEAGGIEPPAADPSQQEDDPQNTIDGDDVEVDLRQPPTPTHGTEAYYLPHLLGLYRTISREGVSQGDIEVYQTVVDSLRTNGVELSPEAGLESMSLQAFFPERAPVNLRVSQEAVMSTIISTIKTWLRKLVEYIKKLSKWATNYFFREERFVKKIEQRFEDVKTLMEYGRQIRREVDLPRDAQQEIQKELVKWLKEKPEHNSPAFVAAMGHQPDARQMEEYARKAADAASYLLQDVASLTEYLKDGTGDGSRHRPSNTMRSTDMSMAIIRQTLDDAFEVRSNKDYVVTELDVTSGRGLGPETKLPETLAYTTQYQPLLDTYDALMKELSAIRQINGEKDLDQVSKTLAEVSKTADDIKQVVYRLHQYNKLKVNALGVYYNLQVVYHNKLMERGREVLITQKKKEWLEKTQQKLNSALSRL